jgi:hypothetical protein
MLISRNGSDLTITLVDGDDVGDEVQALLRAIRDRKYKCELAQGVRMGRHVPSHEQLKEDLPFMEMLVTSLKEHGVDEIPSKTTDR